MQQNGVESGSGRTSPVSTPVTAQSLNHKSNGQSEAITNGHVDTKTNASDKLVTFGNNIFANFVHSKINAFKNNS